MILKNNQRLIKTNLVEFRISKDQTIKNNIIIILADSDRIKELKLT